MPLAYLKNRIRRWFDPRIRRRGHTYHRPRIEQLEERIMLAGQALLPPDIVVGRTLSSYTTAGIKNNQETITYTVYNEQADPVTGVLLTDTLQPGVTFQSASQLPDRSGQKLAWSLGTIQGFDRASVSLTVSLANPFPLQLDTGAHAFATLNAGAVSNDTPAAALRPGAVSPALLASTPDANTTDPFIQEEAAKLKYDPQQIFDFLHNDIGYNSYTGSLRGARGTLWSSAGNALDVASLGVALMRASGIPAQYVKGSLDYYQAQRLILSMFPPSFQTVGYIPAGTQLSFPQYDFRLINETMDHYWFQFDTGNGLKDADPLMAGAVIGKTFTNATGTFTEVADNLRQKVEVKLEAELYYPGFAAIIAALNQLTGATSIPGTSTTNVLDKTFNTVDLVGRPLSISNFVTTTPVQAIFSPVTNTFSPYIEIGDEAFLNLSHDQFVRGTDYQEILSGFPLANQILTGLFLHVTLTGPGRQPQTYERALVDRFGYSARSGGVIPNLSVDPQSPPILSQYDFFTLFADPGMYDPAFPRTLPQILSNATQQIGHTLATSNTQDEAFVRTEPLFRDVLLTTTRTFGSSFLSLSDATTTDVARSALTKAYFDSPRLILSSIHFKNSIAGQNRLMSMASFELDLRRDQTRIIAFPGQAASTSVVVNAVRGIVESVVERNTLAIFLPQELTTIQNTTNAFDAAQAQGIPLILITPDDPTELDALAVSLEAKARIRAAIGQGKGVVIPARAVVLNGKESIAWYEIDPETGEVIGVTENGAHGADGTANEGGIPVLVIGAIGGLAAGLLLGAVVCSVYGPMSGRTPLQCILDSLKVFLVDVPAAFNEKVATPLANWSQAQASAAGKATKDFLDEKGKAIQDAIKNAQKEMAKKKAAEKAKQTNTAKPGPKNNKKGATNHKKGANTTGPRQSLGPRALGPTNSTADTIASLLDSLAHPPGLEPTTVPLSNPLSPTLIASNSAAMSVPVGAGVVDAPVAGSILVPNAAVTGKVTASWTSNTASSFSVQALTADGATVQNANGDIIGAGSIALSSGAASVPITLSGPAAFSVKGTGNLSFYSVDKTGFDASGQWSNYTATVSGTLVLRLTTDALLLNGKRLLGGVYTITTGSAKVSGSDTSLSPEFTDSVAITASGGTINLGPGTGSVTVSGHALNPSNGFFLGGFDGTVSVATAGGVQRVILRGDAANVLRVSSDASAITTDQNTPKKFHFVVETTLTDKYNLFATAPPGWSVAIDGAGVVTVTPAPGLQGGTFPIQLIAQSTSRPELVAQDEVLVSVTPTQPSITLSVEADPTLTVPFNGADLPTAFRAVIHNSGPAADTFNLTFSKPPTGFTILSSATQVTIPAGQTGIVGIYLLPTDQIPSPATHVAFSVSATSTTNQRIAAAVTQSFTVPEIHGVTLDSDLPELNTLPGGAVTTTLTLQAVGNVPEKIALSVSAPAGLTATGLHPVVLAPGDSATETITLTPSRTTSLNSTLDAIITASFGSSDTPITQEFDLPVNVVVPGAVALANASVAARQLGNDGLVNRFSDLSTALTNLVQDPTNKVYKSQAVANIDSLVSQLATDQFLAGFTGALTTARAALAKATTRSDIATAVINLGATLDSLAHVITDEANSRFTLGLQSDRGVILAGAPTVFNITMLNQGNATTTYDFSVSGLPAGVTATFNHPSVTLSPGQQIPNGNNTVTLSLSESGDTLIGAGFTITATAEGAPEITETTSGRLTLRDESLLVSRVNTSPPFTAAGGKVAVSAKVLSAVNQPRTVHVSYVVTDHSGNVLFTSTPVTVALGIASNLVTVNLGMLDTTGFADGLDTITVTVAEVVTTSATQLPLASAVGRGILAIGLPVRADLSVTPLRLPTGNGTVTNTLQIHSDINIPDPLTLDGQVATTKSATTVALYQTATAHLVYVAGTNGIDIVDATDPDNPINKGSFAADLIVRGGFTVGRVDTIGGKDYLLVGTTTTRNANQFTLLVYSLADPLHPALVSTTVIPYQFLAEMLVHGNTVLVPTHGVYISFFGGIFDQFGTLLSLDVSDPAKPKLAEVLFNNRGPAAGGDHREDGGIIVNDRLAYVSTTTSAGGALDSGIGRILVVDFSDPANLRIVDQVDVPGTIHAIDIGSQGDRALVVGSTGGVDDLKNVTLTVLDITDRAHPKVIGTTLVTDANFGGGKVTAFALGNGLFAVSGTTIGGKPYLLLVDPSDPNNLVVTKTPVNSVLNELAVSGNLLYTSSDDGLAIYTIGPIVSIPVTASVQVPKNAVVPGSFNIPPTQIIHGTEFDTLVWKRTLAFGDTDATFTWQSTVNNLGAGEVQPVALGGSVSFVSQGTPGSFSLSPTAVTGVPIISLTPRSQTARPGQAVTYDVRLTNPTDATVTYFVYYQDERFFAQARLNNTVTIGPGGTVDESLQLTPYNFASPGDYAFTVTAQNYFYGGGAKGTVSGNLTLAGDPVPQVFSDPEAHGLVLTLIPSQATVGQGQPAQYIVRLINTGSSEETYYLQANGLPFRIFPSFGQYYVDVPPGASNFRDVPLTLTPQVGTAAGSYAFTITGQSFDSSATDTAAGTLVVLNNGVRVRLNRTSGAPGDTFQMTVTNTGRVTDTFDLSLAGPGALVASLATNQVTLAPGKSQVVTITTNAVDFAVPGTLSLSAVARSHSVPDVQDAASANLNIKSFNGLDAHADPRVRVLPVPGTTSFLLLVDNTGNVEDAFSATITGMHGPVTAHLMGLDGQPADSIPIFRLPGLSTAALLLQADIPAPGTGMVDVQVRSLNNEGEIVDTSVLVTAAGTAPAPEPEPVPEPPPSSSPAPATPRMPELAFAFIPGNNLATFAATASFLENAIGSPVLAGAATLLAGPRMSLDGAAMETIIQGRVILDESSGPRDDTQPGVAGVKVYLRPTEASGAAAEVRTAITNSRGEYEFRDLPLGSYEIGVELTPELRQTAPRDGKRMVDLAPGQEVVTDVNFGAAKPKPQPPAPPRQNDEGGSGDEETPNEAAADPKADAEATGPTGMIFNFGRGLFQASDKEEEAADLAAGKPADGSGRGEKEPKGEKNPSELGRWLMAGAAVVSCIFPWKRTDPARRSPLFSRRKRVLP
jgi:uncharacterized repeat protein (TIGR01451 family)